MTPGLRWILHSIYNQSQYMYVANIYLVVFVITNHHTIFQQVIVKNVIEELIFSTFKKGIGATVFYFFVRLKNTFRVLQKCKLKCQTICEIEERRNN
jgi:hypothetical protein